MSRDENWDDPDSPEVNCGGIFAVNPKRKILFSTKEMVEQIKALESANSALMETAQAFCLKFLAYVKSNEGDQMPVYYHAELIALKNLVLPEKETYKEERMNRPHEYEATLLEFFDKLLAWVDDPDSNAMCDDHLEQGKEMAVELEAENVILKAQVEKHKKALDEIIMWSNEPHSKLDMPKINDIARQARKE